MATAAFTVTSSWTQAAAGPAHVLIPAIDNFHWAITSGTAPAVSAAVCPIRQRGSELSLQLADGESLYVIAGKGFATTVTTGD